MDALYQITDDEAHARARDHAIDFVEAMWDADTGYFHLGTMADGTSINDGEYIAGDVQSWGSLLLLDDRYAPAMDWVIENLQVTDESNPDVPITGTRFAHQIDNDDHNDDVVWLEGTAQAALALRCTTQDDQTVTTWLDSIVRAQAEGPNANGRGYPGELQRRLLRRG